MIVKHQFGPISLREFNDDTMNKLIDRYANQIIKLNDRINELNIYYQPFINRNSFDKENIFGVIVLLEDNFIGRKEIYDRAAEILNLDKDSGNFRYLQSNIKIVGLQEIEYKTIVPKDYIKKLIYNRDHESHWCMILL